MSDDEVSDVDDDFDYLPGEQRPPAGARVQSYPYGGPPRTGHTGPQPRVNGMLGVPNLKLALVIAAVAAIVGGAAVAKLTDRSMLLGGLRQFTAAFLATGMAFVVGHVIGGHIA